MTDRLVLTAGRRWALALGLPFVLAGIGYGGLNYVALVGQDSYRIQSTVAPIANKVTFGLGSGDIMVVPSRGERAVLTGIVNYSLVRPVVKWEHTAGRATVEGPNCFWVGNCGAEFTLAVPEGKAVHASSGSGDVSARELTGALDVEDGSGDIILNSLSGPLVLSAGSGDITGANISATKVQANDSSGDIELSFSRPPRQVSVTDGSGDIVVAVPANVSYLVVEKAYSGSTNIDVPTNPLSHNVIRLTADSGDISVVTSRA